MRQFTPTEKSEKLGNALFALPRAASVLRQFEVPKRKCASVTDPKRVLTSLHEDQITATARPETKHVSVTAKATLNPLPLP